MSDSDSDMYIDKEMHEVAITKKSKETAYLEDVFSKKFKAVCPLIERLPVVAPPIKRSSPNSYADEITLLKKHFGN